MSDCKGTHLPADEGDVVTASRCPVTDDVAPEETGFTHLFNTIIEPFRVKVVEPVYLSTQAEGISHLHAADYNLFKLPSRAVLIDLLTDSGTSAMSSAQWSAIMQGDESYAGSPSFFRLNDAIRSLMGFKHVIPTHQGRAAEQLLFGQLCGYGDIVPNNTHFDTTRANIEAVGAIALDLPCHEAKNTSSAYPFKGNMDVGALKDAFDEHGAERIPLVMVTVTNNAGGGHPVSLANLGEVAEVCAHHQTPLYLDACRFAENAYLIKMREPAQAHRSIADIVSEMCWYADGCTMSAKKDGLANIGGYLALRDDDLARRCKEQLILGEGFPTYGGLAGRDMEAIAVGIMEAIDEQYLGYRVQTVAYLTNHLAKLGVPVLQPPGGHAVFIDAAAFAAHLSPLDLPGISLVNALYVLSGVRAVEIGTAMFGRLDPNSGKEVAAPKELVRLALPRRVYTQSHVDYVIEAVGVLYQHADSLRPYRIVEQAKFLRHFTATYQPVAKS